jgi:hypothetical protein
LTNVHAIQLYNLDKSDNATDQAYVLVNGVANGKEFSSKEPKDGTWTIGLKSPVASVKQPINLWKGDLNDGEFALVTVTLYQGKGNDAKVKEFTDKLESAEKSVGERSSAKLGSPGDLEKLSSDTLKAQQAVVKDVKKTLSREAGTDHFGGMFNVIIANLGGKIVKRLDPIGLTFGEHYGTDLKIYSKLKLTRPNVMMKDEGSNDWSAQQVTPLSDDELAIRVKMLETEPVKGAKPPKHVTDYFVEIQVKAGGKPEHWELGGDHPGPSDVHEYWDFAK